MSRRIAQMLDEPEPQVARLINKLEDKNGYPSHDVRLLAGSIQPIRAKLKDLGLDPDDTTGEELYHALRARLEHDSRLFDQQLEAADLDFDRRSSLAARLLTEQTELPRQWALKKTAAKNVLRRQPPKHVMKQLRYRSVESLLKRADICEIFLAAQGAESATWLKEQSRLVSRLDQTDFELRPLKLVPLKFDSWSGYETENYTVVDNHIGAVGLWPSSDIEGASLLSLTALLLDTLESYRDFKIGRVAAGMNPAIAWWSDMDPLIASLNGEHVSLSLKDCAMNFIQKLAYDERRLEHARKSFWQELVNRYENHVDDSSDRRIVGWHSRVPEPALEFVEDIDG